MNARLTLLRDIDPQQLRMQSLVRALRHAGVDAPSRKPPAGPCLRFELGCHDGGMVCRVDANAWAAVHLPGLNGLDWSAMDPVVLASLLAVDRPLQFADDILEYERADALPMVWTSAGNASLPVVAAAEGEVWIESRSATLPMARHIPSWPADLAVPIRLQMGEVTLTSRRLRRLRGGDIVLLPAPELRAWRGACPLFDFHLHPDFLTVTTVHSPFRPAPEGAVPALHADHHRSPDLTGLDDLPLELGVLLCRLDISLCELADLHEGSVVALPDQASQRVELVHNGRCLAIGELVQVGDRLGVQLAQVPGRT